MIWGRGSVEQSSAKAGINWDFTLSTIGGREPGPGHGDKMVVSLAHDKLGQPDKWRRWHCDCRLCPHPAARSSGLQFWHQYLQSLEKVERTFTL